MLAQLAARIRSRRAATGTVGNGPEGEEDYEEGDDGPVRIAIADDCVVQ